MGVWVLVRMVGCMCVGMRVMQTDVPLSIAVDDHLGALVAVPLALTLTVAVAGLGMAVGHERGRRGAGE